jgi:HD superfamily phosphohydrolase
MQGPIPAKAICVPGTVPVDISEFVPLVDHPLFQRLRGRKQLGVNYLVFPGAVHTRFEHVVGVLGMTQRLCRVLNIQGDESRSLCAYALLHDIGHGPFSHQIEPVAGGCHNQRGIACLEQMRSALTACGLDFDRISAFFQPQNPLRALISDRNLGTDKLDYLRRDALHIGFSGMPDVETVILYSSFQDGIWAVEEKFIEDIKRIQKFYSYLHQHGYLNKTALSVQRVFQRAVQEQLEAEGTPPASLWDMTDAELEWWLMRGKSESARRMHAMLGSREFHRSIFIIKPEGYGFVERSTRRTGHVVEWSHENIRRFLQRYSDCGRLRLLENELCTALGAAPGDVLFAAMPYFSKLVPQDVRIFSKSGGRSYWLFKNDKDHFRSLEGDYLRTFAIRIIAVPELRAKLAAKGGAIADFLADRL